MTATITTTTDISLAKLIPCPANVRRTGAGVGIEALAASILAHGLLQSLVVRPTLDGEGQAGDRYEVVAGGRRLAALRLLAKQKRIAKGALVPCRGLDTDGVDGAEASLAENVVRQDMHPADQFEAFHALHQGGIGIEGHRGPVRPFLAGLRDDRIAAPLVLGGPISGRSFRAYVEQFLAPTLGPGDIVIADNLGSHKVAGVRQAIETRGAAWCSCPPIHPI